MTGPPATARATPHQKKAGCKTAVHPEWALTLRGKSAVNGSSPRLGLGQPRPIGVASRIETVIDADPPTRQRALCIRTSGR